RKGHSAVLRPRCQRDSPQVDSDDSPRHGDACAAVQHVAHGEGLRHEVLSAAVTSKPSATNKGRRMSARAWSAPAPWRFRMTRYERVNALESYRTSSRRQSAASARRRLPLWDVSLYEGSKSGRGLPHSKKPGKNVRSGLYFRFVSIRMDA